MLLQINLRKSVLSSWLLLFFTLAIGVGAGISQFFQAPINNDNEINRYQNLFQPGQILGLREVVLKNSLGTFHFERADNNTNTPWSMISPRNFPANSRLLNAIIDSLDDIKIRTVHQLDAINISNYSLDAPSLEISLIGNDKKKSHLKFGLVNPIDNSTFVTLSGQEAIYHIDNIKKPFGSLDLTDFINTKLISYNANEIKDLRIARQEKQTLLIVQKDDHWVGKNGKKLESDKVMRYFQTLTSLKSNIILDKVDGTQLEQIKKYFEKPLYMIKMTRKNGTVTEFEISPLVRQLTGLKLEKWKNVLFRDKSNQFVYILPKETLKYFSRSERNMRTLPIKKLFY